MASKIITLIKPLCSLADETVLVSPSDLTQSKIIMLEPLFIKIYFSPQAVDLYARNYNVSICDKPLAISHQLSFQRSKFQPAYHSSK